MIHERGEKSFRECVRDQLVKDIMRLPGNEKVEVQPVNDADIEKAKADLNEELDDFDFESFGEVAQPQQANDDADEMRVAAMKTKVQEKVDGFMQSTERMLPTDYGLKNPNDLEPAQAKVVKLHNFKHMKVLLQDPIKTFWQNPERQIHFVTLH